MKGKLLGTTLFLLTFGAIAAYPALQDRLAGATDPTPVTLPGGSKPVVDVVFVLDTTGSMSGLIQTAKEKIWSIASTMASAQPTPAIRIGLVGYRDRGDEYVTKVIDLSQDLDSVYAALMDFEAAGGGDTPESVNRALADAVDRMSWTDEEQAYKVIFLVGDAPPHTDYQDEPGYPAIVAAAREQGILVNTIQCGTMEVTTAPWNAIASLGGGSYFQVEQGGGAVAHTTPFDHEIAELSAKLDRTRLYFGTAEEKARMQAKKEATEKLSAAASPAALARRGVFNSSDAGRTNRLGSNELVDAVTRGEVDLDDLEPDALPEELRPMAPSEQRAYIAQVAEERHELEEQIRELADEREGYLRQKVEEAGGRRDSLDQKLYEAVARQAGEAGLSYEDGPAY